MQLFALSECRVLEKHFGCRCLLRLMFAAGFRRPRADEIRTFSGGRFKTRPVDEEGSWFMLTVSVSYCSSGASMRLTSVLHSIITLLHVTWSVFVNA